MSDKFVCVWSVLLSACLLAFSHSTPISEESTFNSYGEKHGNEISTTESNVNGGRGVFPVSATEDDHDLAGEGANNTSKENSLLSSPMVPPIGKEESEMGESNKVNSKRNVNDEDNSDGDSDYEDEDDDDDDDDETEERGEALLRSFGGVYERAKRDLPGGNSEDENATQKESDFVNHVLDYSLDRKKREKNTEVETTTIDNAMKVEAPMSKRRQNGENVPYLTPNRSSRGEVSEFTDVEEPSGRSVGGERKEENEEEEEEEKREELEEKLAMDS